MSLGKTHIGSCYLISQAFQISMTFNPLCLTHVLPDFPWTWSLLGHFYSVRTNPDIVFQSFYWRYWRIPTILTSLMDLSHSRGTYDSNQHIWFVTLVSWQKNGKTIWYFKEKNWVMNGNMLSGLKGKDWERQGRKCYGEYWLPMHRLKPMLMRTSVSLKEPLKREVSEKGHLGQMVCQGLVVDSLRAAILFWSSLHTWLLGHCLFHIHS